MRVYRCQLDVTDGQGREWEIDETYRCWQAGGELQDRKWMLDAFARAVAEGLHRKGIFYGATIGQPTITLVEQRQPGWDELREVGRGTPPALRLVKA